MGQAQGWPRAPWLLHLLQRDGHGAMATSQQQTSDSKRVSAALCSAEGGQGPNLDSSGSAWSRVSDKKRPSFSPQAQAGRNTNSRACGRAQHCSRPQPGLGWTAPLSLGLQHIHIPWLCLVSTAVRWCQSHAEFTVTLQLWGSHVKQKKVH